MSIKILSVFALLVMVFSATGCKDKSEELACKDGLCVPKAGQKQVVDVEAPAPVFKKLPKLAQKDEPVNQSFAPIHETNLDNDLMSMAGAGGQFNNVALDDVEIPGAGHTEAAISGDMEYVDREYQDNLWPGGVEQSAEMDFEEF